MNLLIIGGGNMGGAIARALLSKRKRIFSEVFVCDPNREKRAVISELGVKTLEKVDRKTFDQCEAILLAVKPQDFSGVLTDLRELFVIKKEIGGSFGNNGAADFKRVRTSASKLILSIAAGIPLSFIRSYLPLAHIIRIMPNTPALIRKGISAWTTDAKVTPSEKKIVQKLLRTLGDEVYIENEKQMDAVTALSGCGPAYVYLFLKSLIEGGEKLGLSRKIATKLAMKTVFGATALAAKSQSDLDTLIKNVASKGGTTEAALSYLEAKQVSKHIQEAMGKAFRRGREMGKK